jgi:hypothetical protein
MMLKPYSLQCLIPVVMSGIIAVYSLVISVLIAQDLAPPSANESYALFTYVNIHKFCLAKGAVLMFRVGALCILHAVCQLA